MHEYTELRIKGCRIFKGYLKENARHRLVSDIREIAASAPMFSPQTPWGRPMSVKMTSAGKYGWYSDSNGYRYASKHPNGTKWPAIPKSVMKVWHDLCVTHPDPECCLVNYYNKSAKMGLHQDKDEKNLDYPVLSISLGDDALFRVGGERRADPTKSIWLSSGDVLLLSQESRLAYHGIERIKFGSSQLLKKGGRLSLTLRVVE